MSRLLSLCFLGAIAVAIGACASPAVQECGATGVLCPSGTHCAAAEGICLPDTNTCGDAHLDPGEVCDDGNTKDGDGCSHDCLSLETCGNHIVDVAAHTPEVCDDGNTVDGDGCSHDCLSLEKCGNGITDINEECDDGNTVGGDGCAANCKLERCGNGIPDPGEACDLIPVDLARCSADCKSSRMCGNGIVDPGEECDNGPQNANNADCRVDCVFNRCGDGFRNTAGGGAGHLEHVEQCDDATQAAEFSRNVTSPESAACNSDCSTPACGDGKINRQFTPAGAAGPEQCDNAGANADNADCTAGCQVSVCGDNHQNTVGPARKEGCDDGNRIDTDACTNACIAKTCGDGIVGPGEQCDLGIANSNTGACLPNCMLATCGDGKVHTGFEDCDGAAGLQPCSATCHQQKCGNGIIDPGEQCDDGNTANNDGCSAVCAIEFCGDGSKNNSPHEACDTTTASQTCNLNCTAPACGDGIVNHAFTPSGAPGPEQCDPPVVGKCSAACQFELCGNGVTDTDVGEECDDGNAVAGDGCFQCHKEQCGNGIVDSGEQCDLGTGKNGDTSACPACKLATCGDGKIETGVEDCDGGAGCSSTCHAQVCGNGIIDPGEECDSGTANNDAGDCRKDCIINRCGDGHVNTLGLHKETCDGGPVAATGSHTVTPTNTATCDKDCTAPSCGDGLVNSTFTPPTGSAGEQCDPPNATNGCSALCRFENCGNGVVDPGEECDDGNTTEGDTCDSNCTRPACGNGIVDPGEACDDGNTVDKTPTNGDLCDHNCTLPSTCGNGIIDPGEVCDDGNTTCGSCASDCLSVTSAPATGVIFAADASSFTVSGDTITVNDGIAAQPVVFELIRPTGTLGTGHVAVSLADSDTSITVASKLATAIGGTTQITATAVNGAIVLQNKRASTTGNKTITTNITGVAGFLVSGLAGGKGGDCATAQVCTQPSDCLSNSCVNGKCAP